MKRCIIAFFAVVLLMFSCTGNKSSQVEEVPADSVADSTDTTEVDSLELLIAETPMPRAADAMFDDFIFNFVANKTISFLILLPTRSCRKSVWYSRFVRERVRRRPSRRRTSGRWSISLCVRAITPCCSLTTSR